ncbi:MAG: ATP synthase F1 subunit delta [Coriobacteriales bacterium]|jgi:F-type H+-transporting ATPase subunit delta|nr:ATP synthase F1 subunit delta [Coriobacteriales bacterium]
MSTDRTLQRKESAVYVQTLLEAVKAENRVFEVSGQLEQAVTIIRGNFELRNTLGDQGVPLAARKNILAELFTGFDEALLAVLGIMVEREDIPLLSRVNEAYVEAAEEYLGSIILDVTTVVELDAPLREAIRKKYSAQLGRDVLLREHLDPSIMGGIVISTHGRRIDASVASQLESARAVLADVTSRG